jgi:hypothetical protein
MNISKDQIYTLYKSALMGETDYETKNRTSPYKYPISEHLQEIHDLIKNSPEYAQEYAEEIIEDYIDDLKYSYSHITILD